MLHSYQPVDVMLAMVDQPNYSACRRILDDNRALFEKVPGSSHNHQAWPGGYLDHVQETMNVAGVFYESLGLLRPLPFTLGDALLVLFLHDIEKPWKYRLGEDGHLEHIPELSSKYSQHIFRTEKLAEYGVVLSTDQSNAMRYVEGELDDYTNRRRVMGPLAAFCHLCDVTSSRIWFDYPSDSWPGATRNRQ